MIIIMKLTKYNEIHRGSENAWIIPDPLSALFRADDNCCLSTNSVFRLQTAIEFCAMAKGRKKKRGQGLVATPRTAVTLPSDILGYIVDNFAQIETSAR
jgi:hypothetical protein